MAEEKKKEDPPPLGPYWAGVPVDRIRQIRLWQEDLRTNHAKQLYQDGHWVTKAIDPELHITVCNQVKTPQLPEEIKDWIRSVPMKDLVVSSDPWWGKVEVFHQNWKDKKDRPDASYDCIVWKPLLPEGSFLHQLHEKLHAFWGTTPNYKFNPHITIGYVGAGYGDAIAAKWQRSSGCADDFGCGIAEVVVKKYKGDAKDYPIITFIIHPQPVQVVSQQCACGRGGHVWGEGPSQPDESAKKKLKTDIPDDEWR
jgi:hypothetical protein